MWVQLHGMSAAEGCVDRSSSQRLWLYNRDRSVLRAASRSLVVGGWKGMTWCMWCWIRVRSHFSVEEEKVLWERKGMVKGLLAFGGVRLRKLSAECKR